VPTPEAKPTSNEMLQRATSKSPERIWQTALGVLQFELPRSAFDTWIRDLDPIRFENNTLVLSVANEYAQEILEKEYQEPIHRALAMSAGHEIEFQIVVNRELENQDTSIGARQLDHHSVPSISTDYPAPDDSQIKDQRLEIILHFRRTWEKIVDPERVVSISRYFVKYWLPILGPEFSSTVLAFKQLRFLKNAVSNEPFQVYVSNLIQWQGISKSTFYRRMENPHPLLSWFVEEVPNLGTVYEQPTPGKIRQKPNMYIVNGGTPLSPPHQIFVRELLLELGAGKDPEKTIAALESSLKVSDRDLRKRLDDSFSDYMEKGNVSHPQKAFSILEIVLEILGSKIQDDPMDRISILAEELENKIIRPDQIINLTWYFAREWQSILKSGAFWLVVFLRSIGFYDRRTSEIRNTFWIDGGYSELGKKIGVSSETVSGWFGVNRKSRVSSQSEHMSRFVHEIERTRGRNENNGRSVSIKLSIEMVDPLTPDGETEFHRLIQEGMDDSPSLLWQLTNYPEKWDSRISDSPEIWDSRASDYPEFRDSNSENIPEKRDSRTSESPEIWDSRSPDSPEFWDSIKDSLNTLSTDKTKDKNTSEKTTTDVNQLLLPLIYSTETSKREVSSRRSSEWDLEKLLRANTIPPGQIEALKGAGVKGQDFAAWILYAYSQEGRGIEKPAFFTAKRLSENPPVLAPEEWQKLASEGPEYIGKNISFALEPFEGTTDLGWGDVMGKISREKLEQLSRALELDQAKERT